MKLRSVPALMILALPFVWSCEQASETVQKIAGCPDACKRMVEDCKTGLGAVTSVPQLGGPFATTSACQNTCLKADQEDATGKKTAWALTVECGIADAVAQAANIDAMCEAFKVCVYREVDAVKLAGCPSACGTIESCAGQISSSLQVLGYSWTTKEKCEADCENADWNATKWDRAATCSASSVVTEGQTECAAFQSCVIAGETL